MQCDVRIETLGAGGDGIAHHDGARVFVPGALPGEQVRVDLGRAASDGYHATLLARQNDGPARTEPECEYFGDCGGCVAQHIAAAPYSEWKQAAIREALAHRGLGRDLGEIAMAPLIACPPASRRRARLALSRGGRLGFRRRGAAEIVDIAHCAILLPKLQTLLAPLRTLAAGIAGGIGEISLTQAPTGVDVILHGLAAPPDMAMREHLADFTHAQGIARLAIEIRKPRGRGGKQKAAGEVETIAQPGAVRARFGAADVALPCGAFLQATAAGEAAIGRLVQSGLALQAGSRAVVADLYAGIGAIGFGLAANAASDSHRVAMFEGSAAMADAAEAAARAAGLPVSALARDLARRPLSVAELKKFDAVIFDPPRAGARAQAETLAASGVARIAAISCNPASFARDARILVDGGYRMTELTPIDQFLWSSHVELVAIFQHK
jgi:23S rRNA (uracil1939-C5)-methyltransferase